MQGAAFFVFSCFPSCCKCKGFKLLRLAFSIKLFRTRFFSMQSAFVQEAEIYEFLCIFISNKMLIEINTEATLTFPDFPLVSKP